MYIGIGIALIVTCIAYLVTKRPHNSWLKIAFIAVILASFVLSVVNMYPTQPGLAISFIAALIVVLTFRTVRGWSDWWIKL